MVTSGTREAWEIPKLEKDVGSKGISGTRSDKSTWGCDPRVGEWLQKIPGTTSKISAQKSEILGTVKILCRTLRITGFCQRTRAWRRHMSAYRGQMGNLFFLFLCCVRVCVYACVYIQYINPSLYSTSTLPMFPIVKIMFPNPCCHLSPLHYPMLYLPLPRPLPSFFLIILFVLFVHFH